MMLTRFFANPWASWADLPSPFMGTGLFDDLFHDSWTAPSVGAPQLAIDETESEIVVRADLPGFSQDDLSISVEGDSLIIKGKRGTKIPENYRVLLEERAAMNFTHRLSLSRPIDFDQADATLLNGVLTLRLPIHESARPKQISVKGGGES